MPWFKVDEHYSGHPAVLHAGNAAFGLWVRFGCWLSNYPKQGDVIPASIVRHYGTRREIQRLVESELLVQLDSGDYRLNHSMAIASSGLPGRSWEIDTKGATRAAIPSWLRAAVYDRDGRACVECEATEDLSLDHIYPHSLGGEDTLDNLRTLCRPCNSRKGAKV